MLAGGVLSQCYANKDPRGVGFVPETRIRASLAGEGFFIRSWQLQRLFFSFLTRISFRVSTRAPVSGD